MDGEFSRGPVGDYCTRKGIGTKATKPYQHYQNGPAERVNRIIREKAAPMMQEPNITGQVTRITRIITQHSKEIINETNIPEKLWPEAAENAVWLKNRSPARALKKREKKTPWEALKGKQTAFGIEKIWGSRAYVSVPPEKRARDRKLHDQRGWLGYWVGCESESISKIYGPDEYRVFNVGNARVPDGVGLDDPQDMTALDRREPQPTSADYDNLVGSESKVEDNVEHDPQPEQQPTEHVEAEYNHHTNESGLNEDNDTITSDDDDSASHGDNEDNG